MYRQSVCWGFEDSSFGHVATFASNAHVAERGPDTRETIYCERWRVRWRMKIWDTNQQDWTRSYPPCPAAQISAWDWSYTCSAVSQTISQTKANHFPDMNPWRTEISLSFSVASACTCRKSLVRFIYCKVSHIAITCSRTSFLLLAPVFLLERIGIEPSFFIPQSKNWWGGKVWTNFDIVDFLRHIFH